MFALFVGFYTLDFFFFLEAVLETVLGTVLETAENERCTDCAAIKRNRDMQIDLFALQKQSPAKLGGIGVIGRGIARLLNKRERRAKLFEYTVRVRRQVVFLLCSQRHLHAFPL